MINSAWLLASRQERRDSSYPANDRSTIYKNRLNSSPLRSWFILFCHLPANFIPLPLVKARVPSHELILNQGGISFEIVTQLNSTYEIVKRLRKVQWVNSMAIILKHWWMVEIGEWRFSSLLLRAVGIIEGVSNQIYNLPSQFSRMTGNEEGNVEFVELMRMRGFWFLYMFLRLSVTQRTWNSTAAAAMLTHFGEAALHIVQPEWTAACSIGLLHVSGPSSLSIAEICIH